MRERRKPWYQREGQERADGAMEAAKRAWEDGAERRDRMAAALERYLGQATAEQRDAGAPRVARWALLRAMSSSIVSRVGSLSNPRVQFVTSDADWETRRKAQKLDRFVDALFSAACPPYANAHELRTAVLQDAMVCGFGVAVVGADTEAGAVIIERVLPWELAWSSASSKYGCHSEIWRRYQVARTDLARWYPDSEEDIDAAASPDADTVWQSGLESVGSSELTDYVDVWECWRRGPDGQHVVLCSSYGGAHLLLDEEWTDDELPVILMRWDSPIVGAEGLSLSTEVAAAEDECNLALARISETFRRTAMGTLLVAEGSMSQDQLESATRDASVVQYTGQPPVYAPPVPIGAEIVQWAELLRTQAYEQIGLSQMAATGERQPGLSSGTAIRNATAVQSQRLSWLSRQQEHFMCSLGKQAAAAARRCWEADKSFGVAWATDGGNMRRLDWGTVDLERDQYLVQVHPVSEAKNSPAARAERIEEMASRGLISQQAAAAAIAQSFDAEAADDDATAQRDLIDSYIDQWLDVTEDEYEEATAAGGMLDEERGIRLVPAPIKWINLGAAIAQVATAYMRAEYDRAPDHVRQCMLTWMTQAEAEMKAQAAAMAPPPAPPAPMGAPPVDGMGAPAPLPLPV